jgi:hypothetical protein
MTNLRPFLIRFADREAEVVEDVADESIAWRAARAVGPPQTARGRFRPDPCHRGTVLPAAPVRRIRDALRRFKKVVETGELVRSA